MVTPSEEFATEKWPPSKQFQTVWLSTQWILGKLSSFEEGKASTESVISTSIRNYLASKMWDLQVCPRTWIPELGQCVSLHFLSFLNTFPGHSMTAREEAGFESVSGNTVCHTVGTQTRWLSTGNRPVAMRIEPPACFRNPKGRTKLSFEKEWKQQHRTHTEVAQSCPTLCGPMDCSPPGSSVHGIFQAWILEWVAVSFSKGMDFQDVLWPYHFGANREKDANFAMNFRYPGSHTRWVQAVYRNFPDKHRLTGSHWISPTEKTWWNRCLDVGLPFPVSVGALLLVNRDGKLVLKNDLQASLFKQSVTLSTQNAGKDTFCRGRKGINRECVLRPLWTF